MWIRIALLGALALPLPAFAQEVGGALAPGPYGVGFTLIQARDSTRAFRAKRDFRGEIVAEETARPVQVGLWYPARTSPDAPRMTAGDFRLLRESELDFEAPEAAEREAVRRHYVETAARFGVDSARARAILDDPSPAVRDAEPVPGPHPTVLYVGAAWVSDPLTAVYLASHGFVVAAFPNHGRMTGTSLEFFPNPLTLETGIDDLGFVYSLLRREPLADTSRLALYAFSATSLHALLWQMRDLQADALVLAEGWERYRRGADIVRANVQYDPLRVRVPVLLLERAAAEASPQYAKVGDVVDSLAYADVIRVAFEGAEHGDFLSHATGPESEHGDRIYPRSLEIVRRFLEARLAGDEEDVRWIDGLAGDGTISVARSGPAEPAPTEEEIFRLAETDPEAAAALVGELSGASRPPLFREHILARAATFTPDPEDRVLLWRMIVNEYPASSDARYRLGASFAEAGRPGEAREALESALVAVSDDPSLDGPDREDRARAIQEVLESLAP